MTFTLRKIYRSLVWGLIGLSFWCGTPGTASSATNDVTAISCPNAVHVADFVKCVQMWDSHQGKTGLVMAVSPTQALTALVRVAGTFTGICPKGVCHWTLSGTLTPVKPDGTALTTDAELVTTDQLFFGSFRSSGALGKVIPIAGEYGGSPIGNEAWDVDANTAINNYLGTLPAPVNPTNVPIGTVVTVVWQPSGITAKFVRSPTSPPVLWVYVPGSMKDANGNPINPTAGALIANPHAGQGGEGSGSVIPVSPWYLDLSGGNTCSGSATATIDGIDYVFIYFVPC